MSFRHKDLMCRKVKSMKVGGNDDIVIVMDPAS